METQKLLNRGLIVLCLFLSIIIAVCYLIIDIHKDRNFNLDKKINYLENEISIIDKEKDSLRFEIYKLREKEDSIKLNINYEKKQIERIIEYRNKENIIITSMPDDELFKLFTKFDSISNKNR